MISNNREVRNYTHIVLCCCLLLVAQISSAQTDSVSYDELSLADLMNVKISVASLKELTTRESPGVVSYISAEEIRESGARDLIDVLGLVALPPPL